MSDDDSRLHRWRDIASYATTCYNANFTSCAAPAYMSMPVSQTDVYTSFNGSTSSLVETKLNSFGNVSK